eukprot:SAG22_NODE_1431_length_4441_cov_1.510134_3_plen_179_part_00
MGNEQPGVGFAFTVVRGQEEAISNNDPLPRASDSFCVQRTARLMDCCVLGVQAFLKRTLAAGSLDAVVMHSYNNDNDGNDWAGPGFLGQTLSQAETMLRETRKHSATAPLWCGECGPHNAGGLPNVTDTFMSSFWYADALVRSWPTRDRCLAKCSCSVPTTRESDGCLPVGRCSTPGG